MIPSPLDELLDRLEAAIAGRDLEAGLGELVRFVAEVNTLPDVAGLVYESRDLDAFCARFGTLLEGGAAPELPIPVDARTQVYLVSALYPTGGHSGVIRDFIRAQPEARHLVVLTDLDAKCDRPEIEAQFSAPNVALHWIGGGTLGERARCTLATLRLCRDGRLFLLTHAHDAVAIAAAAAAAPPRGYFYHHCDHSLALGMHLPGFGHIDVSSFAFHHCAKGLGIARNLYLPLTSLPGMPRDPEDFAAGPDDPGFVTCCAGNGGKFQRPYAFAYPDFVAEVLARTAGRHVHIGDLRSDFLDAVNAVLEREEIDRARFVHVPSVPDLGAAMRDHGVSLYFGSFPVGGAKGLIDVMGSGTPVLGHRHLTNAYLGGQCYLYPEAPVWSTPRELAARLLEFDPARLREHSRLARAFWEANHAPEILRAALGGSDLSDAVPAPGFREPPVDPLRSLLADPSRRDRLSANLSRVARLEKKLAKTERRNAKLEALVKKEQTRRRRLRGELDAIRRSKLWKFLSHFRRKPG